MEKQETKGTITKVVVLSTEELQKLSPEELIAYSTALSQQHAMLQDESTQTAETLKTVQCENANLKTVNEQLSEAHEDLEEKHEKQVAKTKKLEADNATLSEKVKEAKKEELPTFDVDEDKENDIEGGTYQFTCPTFHWDDNSIVDVRKLVADSESDDAKVAEKAQAILGHLVARKSGIIARKED